MAEPRSLYYFAWDPVEWKARTELLSPLARAAFVDLRSSAWTADKRQAPPCSLPDDDVLLARFARLERNEWKKVRSEVRALFVVRDGHLIDEQLLATWVEAHAAYERRAAAGSAGGNATSNARKKGQPESTNAGSNGSSNAAVNAAENDSKPAAKTQQSELNRAVPPVPTGTGVVQHLASASALAPSGAALRAPDATGSAERSARLRELQDEYAAKLRERYRHWAEKRPEEARLLDQVERSKLGLPVEGELAKWQQLAVTDGVLSAWRALPHKHPIPTCDEWIAELEREWVPGELEADEADAVGATP